jgi:DNA primase
VLSEATSGNGVEDALFEASDSVKRTLEATLRELPPAGAVLEQHFYKLCLEMKLREVKERLAYISRATDQSPEGRYDISDEMRARNFELRQLKTMRTLLERELKPPPGTKAPLQPV